MKTKKRKTIFVLVVPRFEDIYHSFYAVEIIKGASIASSRLNIDVLIHITDRFNHRGWLDANLLDPHYIDGILFADIDNDVHVVRRAIAQRIPTMVLNNALQDPINWIAIDNHLAAKDVTKYLLDLGHTRIATIAGDMHTQAGQLRLSGFQEAMTAAGHKVPKSFITYGDFLRTPARQAAKKLLRLKNRPTAIFAASDVMALELLDEAKSMDIVVPDQLSVVGFDNNPLHETSRIPITTVSQPIAEMGRLGVERLKRISLGQEQLPFKVMLPTKLIPRKTTSAAPAK